MNINYTSLAIKKNTFYRILGILNLAFRYIYSVLETLKYNLNVM